MKEFVVEYDGAKVVGSTDTATFQIIIREDGQIRFHYGLVTPNGLNDTFIGIMDPVKFDTPLLVMPILTENRPYGSMEVTISDKEEVVVVEPEPVVDPDPAPVPEPIPEPPCTDCDTLEVCAKKGIKTINIKLDCD